ncbi:MAG: hypothetical protein IJY88_08080 [Clostridia bacterium]|nr:hypothetical protein [Clostridia bacterium]
MANYNSDSTKSDDATVQKKQIISPSSIFAELADGAKSELKFGLCGCALLFVLFGVFVIAAPLNIKGREIVQMLIMTIPIVLSAFCVYNYYKSKKQLANDSYQIIIDKLLRVSENDQEVKNRRGRYVMEHAMYFEKCGRVVARIDEIRTNGEGDVFCIVVRKDKPQIPIFKYNTKYYELVDLNTEE